MKRLVLILSIFFLFSACKKDEPQKHKLIIEVSDTAQGRSHRLVLVQEEGWSHLFDKNVTQGEKIELEVKPGDKISGNITFNGDGSISGRYNDKIKIIAFNNTNEVITGPILEFTVD